MIDYYLHKKCVLLKSIMKQKEENRCNGCVWLDKEINKCIFSVNYSKSIGLVNFQTRILSVDIKQQEKLSETHRRFVL